MPYQGDVTGTSPELPVTNLHGDNIRIYPDCPLEEYSFEWDNGDILGMVLIKVSGESTATWRNLYVINAGSSLIASNSPNPSRETPSFVEVEIKRAAAYHGMAEVELHTPGYIDEIQSILLKYDGSLNTP